MEKPPISKVKLGPDETGKYYYLDKPANLARAKTQAGHQIRLQEDLQKIADILREDRTWLFEKPQTYIVNLLGVFVLGGYLNEHVDAASGEPVLAAGEAYLEESKEGIWGITYLNNRSFGYMPDVSSWEALNQALVETGIDYPREGFSEIYPKEGTWAEILEVLRCA